MAQKVVKIPAATLSVRNPLTDVVAQEIEFKAFIRIVIQDQKFTKTSDLLFLAWEIRQSILDRKPGDEWKISSAAWEKLKEVCREPSAPHQPSFIELVPYFQAIFNAEDEKA